MNPLDLDREKTFKRICDILDEAKDAIDDELKALTKMAYEDGYEDGQND